MFNDLRIMGIRESFIEYRGNKESQQDVPTNQKRMGLDGPKEDKGGLDNFNYMSEKNKTKGD